MNKKVNMMCVEHVKRKKKKARQNNAKIKKMTLSYVSSPARRPCCLSSGQRRSKAKGSEARWGHCSMDQLEDQIWISLTGKALRESGMGGKA